MADLNVQLILRLVDRATGPARAAMRAIERLGGDGFRRQAERVNRGAVVMARGLGTATGAAVNGGKVMAGYAAAVAGVAALMVRPAAQFEQLRVQLTNLEGSAQGADRAMKWIETFATKTPLQLEDSVASYAKLKAFGLDPTNGSLQALVDTMAASGGGAEQLNGLVLALGQAWTKEKLQGEEALQMLERGVPVWDLLGKKLGKNTAELQEMASKGQLGRREITLLIEALAERNAGASENMSKTWDGIISNILDHWGRFQRMIMASGVFDYLKARLQLFLDLLNRMAEDGRLQAYADQVARTILSTLEAIWSFGTEVVRIWNELLPVIAHVADWLGGWDRLAWFGAALLMGKTVLALIGGFLTLGSGIVMVVTGLIGMTGHLIAGIAVIARLGPILRFGAVLGFRALRAAAMLAGNAVLWLGRVLLIAGRAALTNPIVALVAAIAAAVYLIYRNWDSIGPWFQRLWASVKTYFAGFSEFLKGVFTLDFERAWNGIKKAWGGGDEFFRTVLSGIGTNFSLVWNNVIAPVLDKLGLLDPITATWQAFQEAIGQVLDWISAKFSSAGAAIQPVIDALKWIYEKGGEAVSALSSVNTGRHGSDNGAPVSLAPFPGRALGGPVRAGMIYRWQEEGREMFMPRVDGDVISNRQLRVMQSLATAPSGIRIVDRGQTAPASGRKGARAARMEIGGITINAAPGMSAHDVARAVRRELQELARQRGFALHDGGDYA